MRVNRLGGLGIVSDRALLALHERVTYGHNPTDTLFAIIRALAKSSSFSLAGAVRLLEKLKVGEVEEEELLLEFLQSLSEITMTLGAPEMRLL